MDQHLVWLLILLVIGVVVSNLMVLKYTSKFKWPTNKDTNKDSSTDKKTPDNETSSGAENNKPSASDRSQ
jgi:hypothetical protein